MSDDTPTNGTDAPAPEPVGAPIDLEAMRAELEAIRAELAQVKSSSRERKVRDPDEVHGANHRRSKAFGRLAMAIAVAQGKFSTVKRKNEAAIESRRTGDSYGYKYADLGDFIDMARGPLSEAGIAVIQFPSFESDGQYGWVTVETIVVHGESDQWVANVFEMGTSSLRPQDIGIATTYCRRYAYTAILNMISEREDDDGNKASGNRAKFRRDGGDEWNTDDGWQPPQNDDGHPNAPAKTRPPPAPARQPAAAAKQAPATRQEAPPAARQAPAAPKEPRRQEAPPAPKTANTPEEVKKALDDMKPRAQPDDKGPADLANAIIAFKSDLEPAHLEQAIKVLTDHYDATIEGTEDAPEITIGAGHSYGAAHDELTKLYKTLRRGARR